MQTIVRNLILTSLILFTILFLYNCSNCQKQKADNIDEFLPEEDIFTDIDKAKKIFYSLPSPLETAQIIKTAGATYNEELLNPLSNVSKYNTNKSMALNLGIYTTDLSFASLFDQTQTALKYMEVSRKLAEGLGIADAIDDSTMKRLEENLNNKEVVMDIISETFLNSSSYLKENDRSDIAAIVLTGGWIEGLYLATQLVKEEKIKDNPLVDRIGEQKLSLKILEKLLEENRYEKNGEENKDIASLIKDLEPIIKAYDKIKVELSEIKVEPDQKNNVSLLKSETKVSISKSAFLELKKSVSELRTKFIQ